MPTKTKTPPKPAARVTAASTPAIPMPTLTPEGMSASVPGGAAGGPVLTPPGTNGAGVVSAQAQAEAVGAVQAVTIGGLWTSNNQSNAYAYLNGIGWRHISAAN